MLNELLLDGLNEEQRSAVLHGEGPALVVAGPGSGKTTVIIRRLLYLIHINDVPADKILVITFTKEAALSMQEKYKKETRKAFSSKQLTKGIVTFATFHSYFYQIIKSISKYSEYRLITQREKEKIAECLLKRSSKEEITSFHIKNFLSEIAMYKNTGTIDKEDTENWLILFKDYQKILESNKKIDFDDMLYLCYQELLTNKGILEYWQKRFDFTMIDEYQDINPVQYHIIQLLNGKNGNLFVVGDDDQAIYGFRGTDAESFQRFQSDYATITKIFLAKNYRTCDTIVKASKCLIEKNKVREPKELTSIDKNTSKGKIEAIGSVDRESAMEKLKDKLHGFTLEQLDQQAILFRTNASMQILACFLAKNKIPFHIREKSKSIYEHFIASDILDFFRVAHGNKERSLYLRIFQKYSIGREGLRNETVDLCDIKAFYEKESFAGREYIEKIETLERHLTHLKRMRPSLGIRYIMHGMDYLGFLNRRNSNVKHLPPEWTHLLEWLCEDSKDFLEFKSWENHIEEYKEILQAKKRDTSELIQGIHLMTLHASKGLEFEKVYLWQVNEGNMPQYHKGEEISKERLEEERRLCYVGVTRAREEAMLYYYEGTKDNPVLPSRFLEEMGLI